MLASESIITGALAVALAGGVQPAGADDIAASVRQLVAPEAWHSEVHRLVDAVDDPAALEDAILDVLEQDELFAPGTRAAELAILALAIAPDGDGDRSISSEPRFSALEDALAWASSQTKAEILRRLEQGVDPEFRPRALTAAADQFAVTGDPFVAVPALRAIQSLTDGSPEIAERLRAFITAPQDSKPELWASAIERESPATGVRMRGGAGFVDPSSARGLTAIAGATLLQAGGFAASDLDLIETLSETDAVVAAMAILESVGFGAKELQDLDEPARARVFATLLPVLSRPESLPYAECCGFPILFQLGMAHSSIRPEVIELFTDLRSAHGDSDVEAALDQLIDMLNRKTLNEQ
jgi:hypothetical protein